jgi:hypothetical protein
MLSTTQHRLEAAVVAVAPVILLLGFVYQPYIGDYSDTAAGASTIAEHADRWALAQIVIGIGMALTLVALVVVRELLSTRGENRWSFYALPLLLVGGAGIMAAEAGGALLLAAVANSGVDVVAVMDAATVWENAVFGVVALLFGLGWLGYAVALWRAQLLERSTTQIVIGAIVVLVVSVFLPWGWASFVSAVALIVVLWPLAARIWREESTVLTSAAAES